MRPGRTPPPGHPKGVPGPGARAVRWSKPPSVPVAGIAAATATPRRPTEGDRYSWHRFPTTESGFGLGHLRNQRQVHVHTLDLKVRHGVQLDAEETGVVLDVFHRDLCIPQRV